MAHDTEAIKARHKIADIAARYVEKLAREGDEFRGLCPFHKETSPSFTVVDHKGFAHCFGCGWHGDVIAFVQDIHGVSFQEACAILEGAEPSKPALRPSKETKDDSGDIYAGIVALPAPIDSAPVTGAAFRCWNPKRARWTTYQPSMVFPYRDAAGIVLGVVIRVDLGDGKKITPTLRFVKLPSGETCWSHMPFDRPRPIYRIDNITKTLGELIWVEGEKACDAANRLFGNAIASPGGGKGIAHVDWSPLKGRRLLIWGDADLEGERTVHGYTDKDKAHRPGVADLAHAAGAGPIFYIQWDRAKAEGWDAADAEIDLRDPRDIRTWMTANTRPWKPEAGPMRTVAPERALQDQLEKAGKIDRSEMDREPSSEPPPGFSRGTAPPAPPPDHPFIILGHDDGFFYYLPHGTQQIKSMSAPAHNQMNLLNLAPLDHWAALFPHRSKGFDVLTASNALMRAAERRGIFDQNRVRGRGAWMEGVNPVVHFGDRVVKAGIAMSPPEASDRYIYQAGTPLDIELADPLETAEAHHLVELLSRFSWLDPLAGQLLAGWAVIAQICGALPWRPHVWIVGPSQAGKTTVLQILKRAVGPIAEHFEGGTTEAGVRQKLHHDARPGIFDEMESESLSAAIIIQRILGLARIASSGGKITKGSNDGRAIDHVVRSCFAFCSINPKIEEYADERRISKLVLHPHMDADDVREAKYKKLIADIASWLTPDYSARMFSRTVKHLPILLANVVTFTDAAAAELGNRGAADQLAPMLAGLYLCHSPNKISYDDAIAWIRKHRWQDYTAIQSVTDGYRLVGLIATMTRRVTTMDHGMKDFTIGELIMGATGNHPLSGISQQEAAQEIRRLGIMIADQSHFAIANKSDPLKTLLRGTAWSSDWRTTLRTLNESSASDSNIYFAPGINERATYLPIDILTKSHEKETKH